MSVRMDVGSLLASLRGCAAELQPRAGAGEGSTRARVCVKSPQ